MRLETEAKLVLQDRVREGACDLVWSAILDFKNAKNPFAARRQAIGKWRALAVECVTIDESVLARAREAMDLGLGEYDALHVGAAIAGRADMLVTTDDKLLRRVRAMPDLTALPPGEALAVLERWYEN
ncbi:hypothetical protein THSYN_09625 [Candidatus Thiodictyon syntrophicum]|uniref:PIN domain-containing protein n=1 Tax=Candidatus Thiodictyon syntrophicum TaxID=1166950 RepID=A0A2K8U6I4_9GAMM|nr:hypothetical protein THSYN_09625 [Candidatus Thiodictyon syntrophicum]